MLRLSHNIVSICIDCTVCRGENCDDLSPWSLMICMPLESPDESDELDFQLHLLFYRQSIGYLRLASRHLYSRIAVDSGFFLSQPLILTSHRV